MNGFNGKLFSFPQKNNTTVKLKVYGDELYARYESTDGYTVIYDDEIGLYCYALLDRSEFISSKVPLDQAPPEEVVRYLEESTQIVQLKIKASQEKRQGKVHRIDNFDDLNETFGPNQGLLEGQRLSVGKVKGLTILVNFSDVKSTVTRNDVDLMLNSKHYNLNGNTCSVRDYFLTVSSNKLDYSNTVVGPFNLKHNQQHYVKHSLAEEAIQLAIDSGVDLAEFDSLDRGIVDAVNILYAGVNLYEGELWPCNWYVDVEHNGVRTNQYTIAAAGRTPDDLAIGTFCHETGHILCRFPDLYDYGKRDGENNPSSGLGAYCLMGTGCDLNWGLSPAPVCSYLRDLVGWCDNVVNLNIAGAYEAKHGDYNTVMKYSTSKKNEYFLIENRSQIGLDSHIKSSGLAVYHCDIYGSNEYQQGTRDKHYQCALLQADGEKHLETDPKNEGDSKDLYQKVSGPAITSTTKPNSREWDRRESGLVVSDISAPSKVITFKVGDTQPPKNISGKSNPNLSITNRTSIGVSDRINISDARIIRKIQIGFKIQHPYPADLTVKLISPSQKQSLLPIRENNNRLATSLNSDQFGELNDLVGHPTQGQWLLNICDNKDRDTGSLVWWEINISV